MITGFLHQVQLSVFVKAVGMGYMLGILFSLMMLITLNCRKSAFPYFVRDTLFFVMSAFLCFIFSLKYCSGMPRFYVAAGELIGFLVFFIFPGGQIRSLYRKIYESMSSIIKKISEYPKKKKKITKST